MLSLIVAMSQNNVIGDKNKLLWNLKEDLRRFKEITTGHPIIMGRKTYESIGKPLPNRKNIIITRSDINIDGCIVVHSIEEAINMFPNDEEIFIIGGAEIYKQTIGKVDKMYLTVILEDYEGDAFFPYINFNMWNIEDIESFDRGEDFNKPYIFMTLNKKQY
jgi:dihydrofolate reductase